MKEATYSQARNDLADLFDDAAAHLPTRVRRRRAGTSVVVSESDLRALLTRYDFTPEVLLEAGAVAIWLPELAIYGRGATFIEAKDDLVDEIGQLVETVMADARLRSAPNMLERLPWLYRLMLARDGSDLESIVFAEPDLGSAASGASTSDSDRLAVH